MREDLELRMYFFVPYNLSDIQKGIQAGHAALEYAETFGDTDLYKNFINYYKTWIVLNGGTTNNSYEIITGKPRGTLNEIADTLISNDIDFAHFHEPDLNDSLTSICFIADERVFNHQDYPDFDKFIEGITFSDDDETSADIDRLYQDWLNLIGGDRNKILRDLINNKKIA